MINIEIYPASYGDCFLIQCKDENKTKSNILVDCGFTSTYENYLKNRLKQLNEKGKQLDLVVVTHIDADHITGITKFLNANGKSHNPKIIPINEIWHNGFKQMHFQKLILSAYTAQEKGRLDLFESRVKQEQSDFEDVNAEHSINLVDEIYRGKYESIWNSSTNAEEITTETIDTKDINDATIILLSPTKKELEELDKFCLNEFEEKVGLDFKLKDDKHIIEKVWENIIISKEGITKQGFIPVSNTLDDIREVLKDENFDLDKLNSYIQKIKKRKIKQDSSIPNRSSISFILEYKKQKVLFLGDTVPSLIIRKLKQLKKNGTHLFFDAIKIAHHGSNKNTNQELLELVDSENFIISNQWIQV